MSTPPFEAVIHTASPYHFQARDNKKELLEPGKSNFSTLSSMRKVQSTNLSGNTAINGTVGILKAVKKHAPIVKRVIITSSSAAVLDQGNTSKIYSEADWCPITEEQALQGPANGYRASKTFAV